MKLSLDIYREPLFWWFAVGTVAVSALAFLLFSAVLTWLAWKEPAWVKARRIQTRRPRGQKLVWPSLGRFSSNNLIMLASVAASWPLLRMSGVHMGELPPIWIIVLQVYAFIYIDDFLYYWMHRALHTKWLYRHVHALHHRVVTPWAITGNYLHPVEFVLTGTLALAGPVLFSSHIVTIWIWFAFRQWEASEGHCGFDLPLAPTRLVPFSVGAAHHDFHHAKFRGNYAGFLPIWDRAFGTLSEGYAEHEAQKRARA